MKKELGTPRHISHYTPLGFKRVCRINPGKYKSWYYTDIVEELLYSDHRSWAYAITVNGLIYKIGETGQPLGIKQKRPDPLYGYQPKLGTESRFGRYRKGDGTDERCRQELHRILKDPNNRVEFWAMECPSLLQSFTLTEDFELNAHVHKQMEHYLLDYYKSHTGTYPALNPNRC